MMERQAAHLRLADRDAKQGGRQIIPRLTIEDTERQLAALARGGLPVALGYSRE
jgi:predicted phosphoribosyltransferase